MVIPFFLTNTLFVVYFNSNKFLILSTQRCVFFGVLFLCYRTSKRAFVRRFGGIRHTVAYFGRRLHILAEEVDR